MTDRSSTESKPSEKPSEKLGAEPDVGPAAEAPKRSYPLAALAGARPPAPAWFNAMLAEPREDHETTVDGAAIAWRRWGAAGKRGLVFVHGGMAHLGWWDFIAPAFAENWSPIGLSLSGMGASDWRESYPIEGYADEVRAVAEAAGSFDGPEPPVVVAHSFGGFVTLMLAARHGADFAGAVICDTPAPRSDLSAGGEPSRVGGRVYADEAAALARFRLSPHQDCANLFLVDHVARGALRDAVDDAGRPGKTWAHDPDIWLKMRRPKPLPPACPLAFVRGAQSQLVTDARWADMQETVAALTGTRPPFLSVPGAQHHLMLDQPLGLIEALKDLLDGWPQPA